MMMGILKEDLPNYRLKCGELVQVVEEVYIYDRKFCVLYDGLAVIDRVTLIPPNTWLEEYLKQTKGELAC